MNRRGFLSFLGTAATAAAIDPERLLWTPSKKIFIPPAPKLAFNRHAFSMAAIMLPMPGEASILKVGDVISFGDDSSLWRVTSATESGIWGIVPYQPKPQNIFRS